MSIEVVSETPAPPPLWRICVTFKPGQPLWPWAGRHDPWASQSELELRKPEPLTADLVAGFHSYLCSVSGLPREYRVPVLQWARLKGWLEEEHAYDPDEHYSIRSRLSWQELWASYDQEQPERLELGLEQVTAAIAVRERLLRSE